jgi:hypothetical protein
MHDAKIRKGPSAQKGGLNDFHQPANSNQLAENDRFSDSYAPKCFTLAALNIYNQ